MPVNSSTEHTRCGVLERRRVRARLLALGVTVSDVAREANASIIMTSYVLAMRRGHSGAIGGRIVAAAERLSGQSWADLTAPMSPRQRAA